MQDSPDEFWELWGFMESGQKFLRVVHGCGRFYEDVENCGELSGVEEICMFFHV